MRRAKVSFITTVRNDPEGLKILLDSVKKQTRQPDEVVVIEAEKTNTNRSQGRNLGINQAKGEIIVVSDAGCTLNEKWLEEIAKPFEEPRVDVVAGYYEPIAKNIFQKCLACYTSVLPDQVKKERFLPSSRSIAFRKSAWEKAGGYPRNLNYCEDLIFAERLKKAGCRFQFVPKALVYWPQRKNLKGAFKQFFDYASGDVQAHYWPHLKKISLVYLRYFLAFLLLYYSLYPILYTLLALYWFWAVAKNYRYVRHPLAIAWLPVLQLTADMAVMLGALKGLIYGI